MSAVDFAQLKRLVAIPDEAERLLVKPEKEIHFSLNVLLPPLGLVEADAYVVYHNTARGPARANLASRPRQPRNGRKAWRS